MITTARAQKDFLVKSVISTRMSVLVSRAVMEQRVRTDPGDTCAIAKTASTGRAARSMSMTACHLHVTMGRVLIW